MARLGRGQPFRPIVLRPSSEADGAVSGTLAVTTAADTLAASGQVTVNGTLAVTAGADTLAASGQVTVSGTLAKTSTDDTLAASGQVTVSGTAAVTAGNDTLAASGSAGAVSGTLDQSNANDTLAASGFAGTITGTLAVTAGGDTISASGTGPASATVDGGGKWTPTRTYHLGEAPPKRKRKPTVDPVSEPIHEVAPEAPEPSTLTVLAARIAELADQALAQNAALSETDAQIGAFLAYQIEIEQREAALEDEDILILMLAA